MFLNAGFPGKILMQWSTWGAEKLDEAWEGKLQDEQ